MQSTAAAPPRTSRTSSSTRAGPFVRLAPGLALTVALGAAGLLVASVEERLFGQAILEALVVALLLGVVVRNLLPGVSAYVPGASFAAKQVLELAVVLLGLSVDARVLAAAGPGLLELVVGGVSASLLVSFSIGRALGLSPHLAVLVAAGNSICGNSAIAALAPAIGADKKDVASAIALTAVLGVAVILLLPLMIPLAGLSLYQYGVLAGMSVYAVPQVLAATFPVSQLSGQIGTTVKLMRVLLLGPVVLVLGLLFRRGADHHAQADRSWSRYLPWFVVAFVVLAVVRSTGLVPQPAVDLAATIGRSLTILAMAGLGLGVELAAVRRVGLRVGFAVAGSLTFLVAFVTAAIFALGIGG